MGPVTARFLALLFSALALAPANEQTANWTVLRENWAALRVQWEYSHAASAVLNLIALIAVIVSVLVPLKEARRC